MRKARIKRNAFAGAAVRGRGLEVRCAARGGQGSCAPQGILRMWNEGLTERWRRADLTSLELLILWAILGAVVYAASARRREP